MNEDRLNSFWNFPAGMGGYLNLTISDGEKIDGKVNFKNFQLMRSISEKKSQNDFRLAGNLNGSLHLEGTLRNPEINGKLNGDKFVFNDVGYYQTYVELKANKNDIKIDTLNIALNNRSIGNLKANYGFSTDSISLELKGSQLNLENLAETFTQKRA
jgi:autotransporter translocation and assembly factor TamB